MVLIATVCDAGAPTQMTTQLCTAAGQSPVLNTAFETLCESDVDTVSVRCGYYIRL